MVPPFRQMATGVLSPSSRSAHGGVSGILSPERPLLQQRVREAEPPGAPRPIPQSADWPASASPPCVGVSERIRPGPEGSAPLDTPPRDVSPLEPCERSARGWFRRFARWRRVSCPPPRGRAHLWGLGGYYPLSGPSFNKGSGRQSLPGATSDPLRAPTGRLRPRHPASGFLKGSGRGQRGSAPLDTPPRDVSPLEPCERSAGMVPPFRQMATGVLSPSSRSAWRVSGILSP